MFSDSATETVMSLTHGVVPVRFALGPTDEPTDGPTEDRMSVVTSQLRHLLPPAAFPMHLGYGPPPAGYRSVETWRVFPDRRAPRALLPVEARAARAGLMSHNRLRSPAVAATRMLATAALGPLYVLQGRRSLLRLSVPHEIDDDAVDDAVITRHLRRQIPGARWTAISLRDFHPRAKPTVQILGDHGSVLAFAKVASDPATGQRVRREADLLDAIAPAVDRPGSPVRLPALIAQGSCGPFTYSVVEPLPAEVYRVEEADRDRVLRPLMTLSSAIGGSGGARQPLSGTTLWHDVMARVASAQPARGLRLDLLVTLNQLVATVRELDGATPAAVGAYHGDWVPWNMAWQDGGPSGSVPTLWVWDLEYGSRSGPIGLDALRWVFQVEHVERGSTLTDAVQAMTEAAPRLLPRLGVPAELAGPLVRLHVVETMATALTLLAQGRGLPAGLDPDAVAVMQSLSRGRCDGP